MALNFNDRYPSNSNTPTAEYPFGSFKNRSSPTSTDGTTLDAPWSNDFFALHWKLLKEAGMTPNGTADTVESSQYYEALIKVIQANVQKLTTSDKYDGDDKNKVATEYAVGEAYRRTVKRTGDTMTGALNMRNESIPANNTGAIVQFSNVQGVGTFTTKPETGNAQSIVHKLPSRAGILALGNSASVAQNGWIEDTVTGVITQWGKVTTDTQGHGVITFPQAFSSQIFVCVTTINNTQSNADSVSCYSETLLNARVRCIAGTNAPLSRRISWLAIGK